jgi:diguanylate cyclase (GGDEF)-like protein
MSRVISLDGRSQARTLDERSQARTLPDWPSGAAARPEDGRTDVLHQSERSIVYRARMPSGASVVYKKPLGPDSMRRLRHEAGILERLAGVEGVARLIPGGGVAGAIALGDVSGVSLADTIGNGRLELGALVETALGIARIVAAVHRAGVLHQDINPSNILLAGPHRTPILIDFDLATTFAAQHHEFGHDREIAGTLAYLAPEQTGRTGRSVDQRADLYALGITLYELATGRLPFATADPLQLVSDHLASTPEAPAGVVPELPRGLSDIILRLLEKEPDRRYQSAEGLAHDLAALRDALARGETTLPSLGARDFPARLSPPSRPVGRDAEIAALAGAFARAKAGGRRCMLVSGDPGIGKTALVNELRSVAAASGGWYVCGTFDRHRQDAASSAVLQAFGSLAHLLLAEPEHRLAAERERILHELGPSAGFVAAVVPEFAVLLGDVPDAASAVSEATEAQVRFALLELLRIVAAQRPIVLVLDGLQWADLGSIRLVEAIVADERLRGLLLAATFRTAGGDPDGPFEAALARWERLGIAPPILMLGELSPGALTELLAQMLRMSEAEAGAFAEAIGARTRGNPYETIALIDALRQEGALVARESGWHWDPATIRRFVGRSEPIDALADRLRRLPARSRDLVQLIACLGTDTPLPLVRAASGLSVTILQLRLAPALDDGLLVLGCGQSDGPSGYAGAIRFRQQRAQQAAYASLAPERRRAFHLAIARRLAALPAYAHEAAEHYLEAGALDDPAERRRAALLFAGAASSPALATNYTGAEHFLAAATAELERLGDQRDADLIARLHAKRHAVLYNIGRYGEADVLFAAIEARCSDPVAIAGVTCEQITSLCNRGSLRDALDLGLGLLARLGLKPPGLGDEAPDLGASLDDCYAWFRSGALREDAGRPEIDDPHQLATAAVLGRLLAPALYGDRAVLLWLILESRRMWATYGPSSRLLPGLSLIGLATIPLKQDYRSAYAIVQHALAIGESRSYEPATSTARTIFAVFAEHWLQPIEDCVQPARGARDVLLRAGEMQTACHTYLATLAALQESAPTVEGCTAEADHGVSLATRTGNDQAAASILPYRQLMRALRGETAQPGGLGDDTFDEAAFLMRLSENPGPRAGYHVTRAVAAAIFGDAEALRTHADAAMCLQRAILGSYRSALAHLLQGLALAERARNEPAERENLLAALDEVLAWLTARAVDAPGNFSHLVLLLKAERAWAAGDLWEALTAFDAAVREAEPRNRPWHRAFIAERAGLFHLAHGLERAGRQLLADAQRHYADWGASAKVDALSRRHAFLRSVLPAAGRRSRAGAGALSSSGLDLLGLLRTSQALSSETSLERLRERIVELLGAISGATRVSVVLRRDDDGGFALLPGAGEGVEGRPIPVEEAAARGRLPLSAFRYAQRHNEPLLVDDAKRDERFARDPYFERYEQCSLLVVPLSSHGVLRALLFLENALSRGAFSTGRLDAVNLIAGQLAVSLDNALLYASLERKVAERTEALAETNQRLEVLSLTDPLTGLANRRRFADVLAAEWERGVRNGTPLAVAMIDVDHFKSYNDRYGHLAGDRCLRRVAGALSESVRAASDLVSRYGGEEFALILPGATRRIALPTLERARLGVTALREINEQSPSGFVTISAGLAATVPSDSDTPQHLIALADEALYDAKRQGRNRIVYSSSVVVSPSSSPAS